MKNSNETIGNRTRDLPACSAVPQSTALPRVLRAISLPFLRSDRQFLVYLIFTFVYCQYYFMELNSTLSHIWVYASNKRLWRGLHLCDEFLWINWLLLVSFPHFPRFSLFHSLYCPEVIFIFTQTHNSLHNQAFGRDVPRIYDNSESAELLY